MPRIGLYLTLILATMCLSLSAFSKQGDKPQASKFSELEKHYESLFLLQGQLQKISDTKEWGGTGPSKHDEWMSTLNELVLHLANRIISSDSLDKPTLEWFSKVNDLMDTSVQISVGEKKSLLSRGTKWLLLANSRRDFYKSFLDEVFKTSEKLNSLQKKYLRNHSQGMVVAKLDMRHPEPLAFDMEEMTPLLTVGTKKELLFFTQLFKIKLNNEDARRRYHYATGFFNNTDLHLALYEQSDVFARITNSKYSAQLAVKLLREYKLWDDINFDLDKLANYFLKAKPKNINSSTLAAVKVLFQNKKLILDKTPTTHVRKVKGKKPFSQKFGEVMLGDPFYPNHWYDKNERTYSWSITESSLDNFQTLLMIALNISNKQQLDRFTDVLDVDTTNSKISPSRLIQKKLLNKCGALLELAR